jgi:hypothetical protein
MEYMAFYSARRDDFFSGIEIRASSWDEAARLGGKIYLVAPHASGMEQSRVVLEAFGWRSYTVVAVAGPWSSDDERGMRWAAAMILEAYNKGHNQIPGILLWAATIVPEMITVETMMPMLKWGITHKNSMMRYLVTRAAGFIGAPALPIILRAVGDKSEEVQMAAIEAAEKIGPASLPVIELGIKSRNPSIRRRAVAATRTIGNLALPVLQSAMGDSNVDVRVTAVFVARLIGPSAFPILVSAASDNDPRVRTEAMLDAEHFGHLGLTVLEQGIKDRDRHVREAAREALNRMGGRR